MAGVIARQGDGLRALQFWHESLELWEKIGDVRGKATTLANMAWAAGRDHDPARAADLNRRALSALVESSAWLDVVTVLANLAVYVDEAESLGCMAQALWLSMRVSVPVEDILHLCAKLVAKTGGAEAEHAPLLGAAAVYGVHARGGQHPNLDSLRQQANGLLTAGILGQGVTREALPQWLAEQELLDTAKLLPRLDALLNGWVTAWAFDKRLFAMGNEPSVILSPPELVAPVAGDCSPLDGDPASWRAQGLRPLVIRYFSGAKTITLWTSARLPARETEVEEEAFLTLLLPSVSLSVAKKNALLAIFGELAQAQVDELQRILREEAAKCAELSAQHSAQLDEMQDNALREWVAAEKTLLES